MKHITLLLVLCVVAPLLASDYDFYHSQLNADQQKQAIYLEKQIMAPCCFGGPVYSHGKNDLTEQARIDIRKLLVEGKTTDEVLDYFRNMIDPRTGTAYGNRILAAPKSNELVGQVSYWAIVGFVVLGLGVLVFVIRRLKKTPVESPEEETEAVSEDILKRVETELAERD
jgi:cytochrome c-type biogenesis protein CcmH/NrfF